MGLPPILASFGKALVAIFACFAVASATPALAGEARIAVAANFVGAAEEIAAAFEAATGHKALVSFGSTGQLYAQIAHGAPFDLFLAADQARPERAALEGFAVAESRFTYAIGRIALYSADEKTVVGAETLTAGKFNKIAIANPMTAPYGAAAAEAMRALGVYDALAPKIVQGVNVTQAFQFVETENAELGFIAVAQIANIDAGSRWNVPQDLYSPIGQDAILINHAGENEAARAFLGFLRSPEAQAIIRRHGYGIPD